MAWILFGLACLIIIILSIRLFIVSWQREDLIDQNRILQSKIQELKDEEKDLTDQNKYLKNINKNLREKIMLESKLENKNSGISNDENRNNMVRENTGDHEVILVNADINKDLSISHSSYQINSKVLKKKSNSFGKSKIQNLAISKTNCYQINSFEKSRIQNLAISKTNLIINNNIGIGRDLQNKYGSLKIVENINFDVIENRHYCNKGMSVLRIPGKFRQRLEELEKIEKQQISRRDRKIKSKIKDMPAPEPIYEDIKEDDEI